MGEEDCAYLLMSLARRAWIEMMMLSTNVRTYVDVACA